ncbi:MAG: hypothetical protein K5907_08460 [Treponema sp.]|nr:hypothetical protein [Treponema sp.]
MPGISQLKQFNKDIQSLGDEVTLRATRGEKPVVVPIPKGITVQDDSEDFVLGMPDNPRVVDNSSVDEDLSEITGITSGKSSSSSSSEEQAAAFEAPDMSSLLAPVDLGSSDSSDAMPDLSQFMDEPVEEEQEIVEEEPEEISVADMGLEALLAGAGFDGSEGTEEEEAPAVDDFETEEPEEVEEEKPASLDLPVSDGSEDTSISDEFDFGSSDILADILAPSEPAAAQEPAVPGDALPLESFDEPAPADDLAPIEDAAPMDDLAPLDDAASFDEPAPLDEAESLDEAAPLDDAGAMDDLAPLDDVASFDEPAPLDEADSLDEAALLDDAGAMDDLAPLDDVASFDEPAPLDEAGSLDEAAPLDDAGAMDDLAPLDDVASFDEPAPLDEAGSLDEAAPLDDAGALDEAAPLDEPAALDDTAPLDDLGSFDEPAAATEDFGADALGDMDFGDTAGLDDMGGGDEPSTSDLFNPQDVDLPDMNTTFEEIPDGDFDAGGDSFDDAETESEPMEPVDVSQMEDIDFGIQDTDAQLNVDTGDEDFELDSGKISMEGSDFEIPGFSDVSAAPAVPTGKKAKNLDVPDFNGAIPGKELPPNTLSDEQYKQFLKNLNEYPLNVRLAFEDLIVQDEFTDDAEFEIIEKILKKAPARQVASTLEKMLDTSIPVPRDFEHRTAEEYEAYKKSLSYQLKNKILPGLLCGILVLLLGWGLFNFGKNCIYIPAKASKLYKQGYALLQADEYVQSQIKFDEAASYQLKKKWFFNYARGYREHKQYQRAADIYGKLLIYFNHDKTAGLEYARMELEDLVNYEKAEEITRREVLDYHINDADGILMLGDIFLEWGTEADPSKLELAKEQYMTLIQLYKPNDLYNSRLMRYYIRSDNFQQVLSYKEMFESQKKADISSEDWTELGGYLLNKLYGDISPSEESLRYKIEGLLRLLIKATDLDDSNAVAWYNLGNYYVYTNDSIDNISYSLKKALERFNKAPQLKKRDIYKYIDTYRLLGENYLLTDEYLQAQEQFTQGITLYNVEKENAGLEGNEKIGLMYADLGNINYTIAGDYENAANNYKNAVALGYDIPQVRYRLGYISYKSKNYLEALGSFMKAGEANQKERNLLLAMANTLSLRNDDYAAEGYYEQLISKLDTEIAEQGGTVFPQTDTASFDLITTYLYAANNYGVTLYKLAKRTGNSQKNAQAIVQLQQSVRAWDSLTRDPQSLVRLDGSNLAQENIKYLTHPVSEFEPAIYIEIPKNLTEHEGL